MNWKIRWLSLPVTMQWPDNEHALADTVREYMGVSVTASPAWPIAAPAVFQLRNTAEQHFGALPSRFWGHHIFTQLCWQGVWLSVLQHTGLYLPGGVVDAPVAISQGFARGISISCLPSYPAPMASLNLMILRQRIDRALQHAGVRLPGKEQRRLMADQLAAACRRLLSLGWGEQAVITREFTAMLVPWGADLIGSPETLLRPDTARLTCCRYEMASQQYCAGCPKARHRQ